MMPRQELRKMKLPKSQAAKAMTIFANLILLVTFLPFVLLILVRELGRWFVAHRAGVMVFELVIGFGPCAWRKRLGETTLSINLVPLGGFLEMERDDYPLFHERGYLTKSAIILAGPACLLLLAIVLNFVSQISFGSTEVSNELVVGAVLEDYPASNVGLQTGDRILSVNGSDVQDWSTLSNLIATSGGREIELEINRGTEVKTVKVNPIPSEPPHPQNQMKIGISPERKTVKPSLMTALNKSPSIITQVIAGVGQIFQSAPARPIVILGQTPVEKESFTKFILYELAIGCVILAFIFLVPIPYLTDGGHFTFFSVDRLKGLSSARNYTWWANRIGLSLLPIMILLATLIDILNPW